MSGSNIVKSLGVGKRIGEPRARESARESSSLVKPRHKTFELFQQSDDEDSSSTSDLSSTSDVHGFADDSDVRIVVDSDVVDSDVDAFVDLFFGPSEKPEYLNNNTTNIPQDLFSAVAANNYPRVVSLLKDRVSLEKTNAAGDTVLHVVAREENLHMLYILLRNIQAVYPETPEIVSDIVLKHNKKAESALSIAVQKGNVDMCKKLVGVTNVIRMLHEEDRLLSLAVSQDHIKVAEFLLDYLRRYHEQLHVHMDVKSKTQDTVLHLAAHNGCAQTTKWLIEKFKHLVNMRNDEQHLPLHKAVSAGKLKTVQLILQAYADDENLSEEFLSNTWGLPSVMRMAIDKGQETIVELFIEHCHWESFLLVEEEVNIKHETPMLVLLIQHMPCMASRVMDKCWQQQDSETITANYQLLDNMLVWKLNLQNTASNSEGNVSANTRDTSYCDKYHASQREKSLLRKNHPLQVIADTDAKVLMDHPLVRALLSRKWKRAAALYFSFLFYYFVFLALITTLMFKSKLPFGNQTCVNTSSSAKIENTSSSGSIENTSSSGSSEVPPANIALTVAVYVFAVFGLVVEIIQLALVNFKRYFEYHNMLDLLTYVCPFIVFSTSSGCGLTDWQWQLGIVCLFVTYINMLFYLRIVPMLGIYIMMVTLMLRNFLRFFLIMFLFLLSFGICFNLLLQNQVSFSKVEFSVMKSVNMMLGDIDFAGIFLAQHESDDDDAALHYNVMVWLLYIAFLVLMALVMLNLLTSLAVVGVEILEKDSRHKILALQINLALDVEIALPMFLREMFECRVRKEEFHLRAHNNQCVPIIMHYIDMLFNGSLCQKDIIDQALEIVKAGRKAATEEPQAPESLNIKNVDDCIFRNNRLLILKVRGIEKALKRLTDHVNNIKEKLDDIKKQNNSK